MSDLLKKALVTGGAAALATPFLPEESESASFPWKDLEKTLAIKHGKAFNDLPGEAKAAIKSIYTRDIPGELGLKTPIVDEVDRTFMASALKDKDFFKFDPKVIENVRKSHASQPDELLTKLNPGFRVIENTPDQAALGRLISKGDDHVVAYNLANPNFKPFSTSWHEGPGHGPQNIARIGSFDPALDPKLDFLLRAGENTTEELRSLPYSYSLINSDFYKKGTPEQQALIDHAFKIYQDNPLEVTAREIGEYGRKNLVSGNYNELKDFENFKNTYNTAAAKAYKKYIEESPENARKILSDIKNPTIFNTDNLSRLKKYSLAAPFAVAETQLVNEGKGEASIDQEKSNLNGLVNEDNVYNAVKNAEAKNWIKTPKGMWETAKIALGAIAPGLPAAQAGIKKFVVDEVSEIGKSVKKIVSQTEAGEKADWEDYKNVLNLANRPGLLLMGHDVAQAVGEPVGKKAAEGLISAYDNFILDKRIEEQATEDFFK